MSFDRATPLSHGVSDCTHVTRLGWSERRARAPHARLERSRAPLSLPPRGLAGRLAAAQAPARSKPSAATTGALIRPPHREVQRLANTTLAPAGRTVVNSI